MKKIKTKEGFKTRLDLAIYLEEDMNMQMLKCDTRNILGRTETLSLKMSSNFSSSLGDFIYFR